MTESLARFEVAVEDLFTRAPDYGLTPGEIELLDQYYTTKLAWKRRGLHTVRRPISDVIREQTEIVRRQIAERKANQEAVRQANRSYFRKGP